MATITESRPFRIPWDTLVAQLQEPDGGFTFHARTFAVPTEGYAVSVYPDRAVQLLPGEVTRQALIDFATPAMLDQDVDVYVGGWNDPESGAVFLDFSLVVPTQEEAMAIAQTLGERAIYHLNSNHSIPTTPVGA